ncbi:hypothetical protein [Agromyces marinus]|uniref:Uncharacterized protein n=1 Tax=Agromyces marinus TaxID=1389020 RepID=A0ABM8H3V3_9MICO|nr:hypothetical protein [Agromyces marinus]UIP59474.1 hypothetical protein DSM26151_23810 [Agromyces marinus]BDZ55480.1 hypothetical protein GCM10025870_25530 [Agromyces marinus]
MSGDRLFAEVADRWVEIPAGLADSSTTPGGETDRTAWLRAASEQVRALGAAWPDDTTELVPTLLEHALAERGDEHLVLTYWPEAVPMPATVRVAVLASPGRSAVAAELRANPSAHIEHVDGARLGPGVEWVHGGALPEQPGEQLIGTQTCFTDDDTMVLVTLEPTLPPLLPHVIDAVRELARTLERVRDDRPWVALALPEDVATRADVEAWQAAEPEA